MDGWFRVVGTAARVEMVMFFDCSEATMEQRCLTRGQTSGRTDDNIDSIRKRFHTYRVESMPIIQWFEADNKVRYISADRPKEEVWLDVKRAIEDVDKASAVTAYKSSIRVKLPEVGGVEK